MSNHAEKSRYESSEPAEKEISDKAGNNGLSYISGEGNYAGFFAEGSHHICHSGITRSEVAYIRTEFLLGYYNSKIYASEKIRSRYYRRDRENKEHYIYR